MTNLLPTTKFHLPAVQDTIKRTTLIEQFHRALFKHRLTLVSAPAGSGKTNPTADAVRSIDDATVKWLSLDADDNEPRAFGLALALAILNEPVSDLLATVQHGQIQTRQLVTVLINRLAKNPDVRQILVLDDLHLITDQTICDALDYFIERLPVHVHIVATTRRDPPLALARLRARGDLAEFRLDALRFGHDEVDILLN